MTASRLHAVLSGEARDPAACAARCALSCGEPAYRGVIAIRNAMFDRGVRKVARLPRPVISVGNITTGGTGKTPMVIELAQRLRAAGRTPAVLLRGYRGRPDPADPSRRISDESLLYERELGSGIAVEADPDRVRAAHRAITRCMHALPDLFILDDGFQHRRVYRDLDLVLIDATNPFGFGRFLPRGLLREPVSALRRADAIIMTRADQVTCESLDELDGRIASITGRRPIAHAAHRWVELRGGDDTQPIAALREMSVVGICGIGNPAAFERSLRERARDVTAMHVFSDHEGYEDVAAVRRIMQSAKQAGADAVVTTEKDWVKLRERLNLAELPLPVLRPVLRVQFIDGEDALAERLAACCA